MPQKGGGNPTAGMTGGAIMFFKGDQGIEVEEEKKNR